MSPEEPPARSAAAIAEAVALGAGITVVETPDPQNEVEELEDELRFALEATGLIVVGAVKSGDELLQKVSRVQDGLLLVGLGRIPDQDLGQLDVARNRMMRDAPIVFLLTPCDVVRLRRCAPNVWSWIGAHWYRLALPDREHALQLRLESLRSLCGLTDEELTAGVAAGNIEVDPVVAEWLSLLGRGDLIHRD